MRWSIQYFLTMFSNYGATWLSCDLHSFLETFYPLIFSIYVYLLYCYSYRSMFFPLFCIVYKFLQFWKSWIFLLACTVCHFIYFITQFLDKKISAITSIKSTRRTKTDVFFWKNNLTYTNGRVFLPTLFHKQRHAQQHCRIKITFIRISWCFKKLLDILYKFVYLLIASYKCAV